MMKKVLGVVVPICALVGVLGLMVFASQGVSMPVIDTRGDIAEAQKNTLYFSVLIMLIVIIPVFILLFFISWRYRENNKKAAYKPNWSSNKKLEAIWWGIPIAIIGILSVVVWQTSHSLDPYKELVSDKKPVQIQVVALQYKWLFIYPDESVASIGEFAMPVDTPVTFTITSDAPMNSFWIPQLGGQVYAMSAMSTKLHLNATEVGDYRGSSANISGEGHASMTFTAKARTDKEYAAWVEKAKKSPLVLSKATYEQIRLPSIEKKVSTYKLTEPGLYDSIVASYSGDHSMSEGKTMTEHIHEGGH
jgi:cytochrome o ubiquinol oxidase subunit 2